MSQIIYIGIIAVLIAITVALATALLRSRNAHLPLQHALDRAGRALKLAEGIGGVGTWMIESAENRLHWSDKVFAIHGRPVEKGPPPLAAAIAYFHPADRAHVLHVVNTALHEGRDYEFRARLIAEDGIIRPVMSRAQCQLDDNGKVSHVYGVFIELPEEMPPVVDSEKASSLSFAS
ncbi:MAG: PAS domain-containing protein [Blastomonas sp.]